MPTNNTIYHNALLKMMNGTLDMDTDDIRCLLVKSTHDSNRDDDTFGGMVALGEITVSGYSRQALTNEAVNIDEANNRAEFDADNVTFSALVAGETVTGIIVYLHNATPGSETPICFIPVSPGIATNGGDIVITWNAEGIFAITGIGD